MSNHRLGLAMEGLEDYFFKTVEALAALPLVYHEIGLGEGATFLAVKNFLETHSTEHQCIGYECAEPEFSSLIPRLLKNGVKIFPDYSPANGHTLYASSKPRPHFVPSTGNDLVFIDGCHCYRCVKADILSCRKLKSGTLLFLHDSGVEDLKRGSMQCSGPLAVHSVLYDMGILDKRNPFFEYVTQVNGAATLVTIQVK